MDKFFLALFFFSLCSQSLFSKDLPYDKEILEKLFSFHETAAAFEEALSQAEEQKIPEQILIEAKLIFYIDTHQDKAIAELAPVLQKNKKTFQVKHSAIFTTQKDWHSAIHYALAMESLLAGKEDAFQEHIKEAFWLAPHQSSIFVPYIEKFHLRKAMEKVTIDLSTTLKNLDGKRVSLQTILQKDKALLLNFWAGWDQHSVELLEFLPKKTTHLKKFGIVTIPIHMGISPEMVKKIKSELPPPPISWFMEAEEGPLSTTLRVYDPPRMILLNPQGKVLFNGHPTEEELWKALKEISPKITRP